MPTSSPIRRHARAALPERSRSTDRDQPRAAGDGLERSALLDIPAALDELTEMCALALQMKESEAGSFRRWFVERLLPILPPELLLETQRYIDERLGES